MARSTVNQLIKFASEQGLYMGLYLTLMSACIVLSTSYPQLPMLLLPLSLFLPLVLWRLLKPTIAADADNAAISPLWLTGIYIFIFATLICGLLTAGYLNFFHPTFVIDYVQQAINTVENSPMAAAFADQLAVMNDAIARKAVPTFMEFVFSMMWSSAFFGSIISLIVALVMNFVYRKRPNAFSNS